MVADTKKILQALPFDKAFKNDLLAKLDSYDTVSKFQISQIIWDTYFALYELKLDENLDAAFERGEKNQETFDENFYKRARALTDKQMEEELISTNTKIDLTTTREKLEELMKKPGNS